MLADQVNEILFSSSNKTNTKVIEQIKYLEDLEHRGIISPPQSQTAYKYPVLIELNRCYK